mmetsp:Transcript_120117/g.339926  ORF Transcript_120117/g.339926 Transcript_120117/m.339926 type:complete len:512 (-) Transcript_120117:98-1633(-)
MVPAPRSAGAASAGGGGMGVCTMAIQGVAPAIAAIPSFAGMAGIASTRGAVPPGSLGGRCRLWLPHPGCAVPVAPENPRSSSSAAPKKDARPRPPSAPTRRSRQETAPLPEPWQPPQPGSQPASPHTLEEAQLQAPQRQQRGQQQGPRDGSRSKKQNSHGGLSGHSTSASSLSTATTVATPCQPPVTGKQSAPPDRALREQDGEALPGAATPFQPPVAGKQSTPPDRAWREQDWGAVPGVAPAPPVERGHGPHLECAQWEPPCLAPKEQLRHDPILHVVDVFARGDDGAVTARQASGKQDYARAQRAAAVAKRRYYGRRRGLAEFEQLCSHVGINVDAAHRAALARDRHAFHIQNGECADMVELAACYPNKPAPCSYSGYAPRCSPATRLAVRPNSAHERRPPVAAAARAAAARANRPCLQAEASPAAAACDTVASAGVSLPPRAATSTSVPRRVAVAPMAESPSSGMGRASVQPKERLLSGRRTLPSVSGAAAMRRPVEPVANPMQATEA